MTSTSSDSSFQTAYAQYERELRSPGNPGTGHCSIALNIQIKQGIGQPLSCGSMPSPLHNQFNEYSVSELCL